MSTDRLTITMSHELSVAARKAAKQAKQSISAWLAEATAARLRHAALGRAVEEWESEFGALTPEELAAADWRTRTASRKQKKT